MSTAAAAVLRGCPGCGESKPLEAFRRRRNDSPAKLCDSCRRDGVMGARIHGQGYGRRRTRRRRDTLAKWRAFRDGLVRTRDRDGERWSEYAAGQLAVAEALLEDLENEGETDLEKGGGKPPERWGEEA